MSDSPSHVPAAELDALREAIGDVLGSQADRAAVRKFIDTGAVMDDGLWRQAAALGWFGLGIAEEDGGLGLGIKAVQVLCEALGGCLAPLPATGTLLAAEALSRAGSLAQRAAYLPAMAGGELMGALALPGIGDLPRLSDDMVLTGGIELVADAAGAGLVIIPARFGDGWVFLVLDVARHGVVVTRRPMADLTRQCADLGFPGLTLDESCVLGGTAGLTFSGAAGLGAHLNGFAGLLLAADSIGAAKGIFAATVDYLKTRTQFGKPIGSFQALKHRAADHHVALTTAAVFLGHAASLWEAGSPDAIMHASLARAHVCAVATEVAMDAIQMHGGIGFTWDHECHLFLKRVLLNETLFGATAAHLDHAAALLETSFAAAA